MSNSEGMTTPSDRLRLPRTCMKSRVTANRKGKSCCSSYILQSTAALSFLHARRLVHRDVKLENVLLYDSGCRLVKLGDFGVARHCGMVVCRVCRSGGLHLGALPDLPRASGHRRLGVRGRAVRADDRKLHVWCIAYLDTDDRLYVEFVS